MNFLTRIFGNSNDRLVRGLFKQVTKINQMEQEISQIEDLSLKTLELVEKVSKGEDVTTTAFALVREAGKRALGMRHFDEQLVGGLVLKDGKIAEMATGEGKTLVATLPAYLKALHKRSVHIVTVNDYLAQRDALWMRPIYETLGMTSGYIISSSSQEERLQAYNCDVTYITNNELGFDYLRDNMKYDLKEKVQKELFFVIVDEVDSVLIDEARTPLIISGPVDDRSDVYAVVDQIVRKIDNDDIEKDDKSKSVYLNEHGINKVEMLLTAMGLIKKGSSLYDFENLKFTHYLDQSLKAHNMFHKDVDYIKKDGAIYIIDEFTGRIMEGRRYSDGLHQAIEAKERVEIQNENQTLASITFQNYFRMYKKISGMTGTAATEANEFLEIYGMGVVSIPTHKKIARIDHDDEVYGSLSDKHNAILSAIKSCWDKKQPILIGTTSIEKSEALSAILSKQNIPHNILNAKQHHKEAYIIAQAGRLGAITIATNMAGRGTDIKLGGNPDMIMDTIDKSGLSEEEIKNLYEKVSKEVMEEKKEVEALGGLYVLGTERHESRRIDNQFRGRSGRQGDPGETKSFLSLEDDLIKLFAPEKVIKMLRALGLKDGEAINHSMINRAIEKAQAKVEAYHKEIRKNILKYDDVMNQQRKIIYIQRESYLKQNLFSGIYNSMAKSVLSSIFANSIPKDSLPEQWDIAHLSYEIKNIFAIAFDTKSYMKDNLSASDMLDKVLKMVSDKYLEKENQYTSDIVNEASKYILISILDHLWKDHLHSLDHMRQGISLRAYGQKDPLREYKKESFDMFEAMQNQLEVLFVQRISHLQIGISSQQDVDIKKKKQVQGQETRDDPAFSKYNTGSEVTAKVSPRAQYIAPEDRDPNTPSTWGKINRNELCPCKSGKKYKFCHGKS